MSYYINIVCNLRLNKSKVKDLQHILNTLDRNKEISQDLKKFWLQKMHIVKIDNNYYTDFNEYYSEFSYYNTFCSFIMPFLDYKHKPFYDIYFYGEDNETWGVRIYKNKLVELEQIWREVYFE